MKKNGKTQQVAERSISIWLDGYDDIFSDFDSRPYTARILSDDFVAEVRKLCHESDLNVKEMNLLMPAKLRLEETENVIQKRLGAFFRENHLINRKKRNAQLLRALLMLAAGLALMFGAAFVDTFRSSGFGASLLFVIIEPAGWFLVWTGLDNIIYSARRTKPELVFYRKMSAVKPVFRSIS